MWYMVWLIFAAFTVYIGMRVSLNTDVGQGL